MGAIENYLSPVKDEGQVYIYFAKYFDGKEIYEYDNEGNHLRFQDVNQSHTKYFGLIGNGMKMYWDISTGIFHLGKNEYIIKISSDDEIVNYLGINKDLITFKNAHTDSMINGGTIQGVGSNIIDAYFIGFKMNYKSLFIQILFGIPVTGTDRRPFFGIRISNKEDKLYNVELLGLNGENKMKFSKNEVLLKDGKSSVTELYFN